MQRPFHRASERKILTGGSNAAKESGACGSGPPRQCRVRPTERERSDLFTAQKGAKSQPVALLPQRTLGLLVQAPQAAQLKVRPAERKWSNLFTVPLGAKWQPAALMPQRSLGLVVRGLPGSVELFP
ncbi:hypothetical protein NDU88_003076 [Pleurodeles waltl]|uniref:Uncharacterized protein n=1 Tax=Pleurodeles waltl TaxID=8319 RepID=A0AAV7PBA4_PLEWA|nr:hypothetical protein NDU88_003076 [Pleurodeles waltl]